MKLIKEMVVGVGFLACMVGCRSGLYEFETTENDKSASHMPYRVVDKLDPEKYSAEFLPVEVKVEKKKGSDHSAGMAGLCCLTIGIIPALYDEFEDYTITVNTPIGSKSANAKLHAKSWVGWICLIPYPASGEERDGNPTLPNERLEEKLKNQVVEALVGKFSAEEYAGYVRKLKDEGFFEKLKEERLANEKRAQEKCKSLSAQLDAGEFEAVIKACDEEMAASEKDAPWEELKERAIIEMVASQKYSGGLCKFLGNCGIEIKECCKKRQPSITRNWGEFSNDEEVSKQQEKKMEWVVGKIENQDILKSLFREYFKERESTLVLRGATWQEKPSPAFVFSKMLYAKLSEESKQDVVVNWLCLTDAHEKIRSGRIYRNDKYDFKLERQMIHDYRTAIFQKYGDDLDGYKWKYGSGAKLTELRDALYTPEELAKKKAENLKRRGAFEGIFGQRFGSKMEGEPDESTLCKRFNLYFYRVPFVPDKKGDTFSHYYVWLTPKTKQVFAIEARSDSAFDINAKSGKPELALSLEKKYGEYFHYGKRFWEMKFNEEDCRLNVMPDLSKAISDDTTSKLQYNLIMCDVATSSKRGLPFEPISIKSELNGLVFDKNEAQKGLVYAESGKLHKLAAEETVAIVKAEKEAEQNKKEKAATNAADQF